MQQNLHNPNALGRSLVDMAQRDLDAALQLLADRAQYITGATGAAIALRRDGRNDMQCRATSGSNAPELGALLSTEFGLSGESVRTRRPLRCDDAERDARVNHEVCRKLGIASVVVMPVVTDDGVLGVFELFSGKVNAFGERDLSAVQRLSEMVETAVRLAQVAVKLPDQMKAVALPVGEEPLQNNSTEEILDEEIFGPKDQQLAQAATPGAVQVGKQVSPAPPKKLFWSLPVNPGTEAGKPAEADQSHVPPILRSLRKCEVCGFPVSAGRVLCVECEEKKWRGQLKRPSPPLR